MTDHLGKERTTAYTRVAAMVMRRDQIPAIFKIHPSGFAKRMNVRYVLKSKTLG